MALSLSPTIDDVSQEYVLVQAWKKTAAFIRYHNWFSDVLELDRAAVNLPEFLAEIRSGIRAGWQPSPLRIVPAPKSQEWHITSTGDWRPKNAGDTASKIRPLAHVSLKDQVASTAAMLCLADRVETWQGDPRISATSPMVISYGNRLFADQRDGVLRHRWASSKLYRSYFEDYRSFLSRPENKAAELAGGNPVFVIQMDLAQFYDRVTPELLHSQLDNFQRLDREAEFFNFLKRLLNWTWAAEDTAEVKLYALGADLGAFDRISLPQGLVGAGFFANAALFSFDQALRTGLGSQISEGLILEDVVRYVDDLRLVLSGPRGSDMGAAEDAASQWIENALRANAPGLKLKSEKTTVSAFRGEARPLVQQSRRMERIQTAVSGGFDAIAGGEILDAVAGLVRTQKSYASVEVENRNRTFLPVPDVRDSTVDRFAAGRFRATYRSLRPLLWDEEIEPAPDDQDDPEASQLHDITRNRSELDDEARAFALGLIDKWTIDPSNVRLLRIGLDIWPAADVLGRVLALLRPFTEKGGLRKAPRRVAWYCLAEILRAGATETGFVEDGEALSPAVDVGRYRELLCEEALRLISAATVTIPWYLKQQAYLVLAANRPAGEWVVRRGQEPMTRHYRELLRFVRGDSGGLSTNDFVTNAVVARRCFLSRQAAVNLLSGSLTQSRMNRIASVDPAFARELVTAYPEVTEILSPRLSDELGLRSSDVNSLSDLATNLETRQTLRNEVTLLSFALAVLRTPDVNFAEGVVLPADVSVELRGDADRFAAISDVKLRGRSSSIGSVYDPPAWCAKEDRWRFVLGYLLRFILTGQEDFSRDSRQAFSWREDHPIYRPAASHWYQRLYSLYSGHDAFGDDWLPISEWTENLLFALLNWPGCELTREGEAIAFSRENAERDIKRRLDVLLEMRGKTVDLIPLDLSPAIRLGAPRPLRACIVQSVIPLEASDFNALDITFSSPGVRTRHRRHLSAALAAVSRMLALRETHKGRDGRLDLLIFPELAIHPNDVKSHLVPFARAHKTIILTGLTYEHLFAGAPAVNSALWIIPTKSASRGLQILTRRQGKANLAPNEMSGHMGGLLQGFRPCQWLVGYRWSADLTQRPLWLSASVCYDATDIQLAADLKKFSDVFVVPALNKDISTFDQMALALHYHMFQMVIIANSGRYGGSNAYAPYRQAWDRQIFHVHGQPQATISFFELDDIAAFIKRYQPATGLVPAPAPDVGFKSPPAGPRPT